MKKRYKTRARGILGVVALIALVLASPAAFSNANDGNPPPPPTVTSPAPNSRLPDPVKVTIRGLGSSLATVNVRIDVSHVSKGKRVNAGERKSGAKVPSNGDEWKVEMVLPEMNRGWVDVRYTITAQQFWKNEHNVPHISKAGSKTVTFDVFPQAQPEPLPVAPPTPVIQTPTSGTVLKREPNIHITGTGTPGNQIQLSTQLFYAVENSPGQERKNMGASTKMVVDKSGKWQAHLGYGGYTEPDYLNPRVRIVAREVHRESPSLVSHDAIREVAVEVPLKREPTRADLIASSVRLPDHVIASSNRIGAMTPAERAALMRQVAKVTSPTDQSTVRGSVEPKGTAEPGSNLEVSVKRVGAPALRVRGKSSTKPAVQDLGTFTTRANSSGEWKIRPVTLPALRNDSIDMNVIISVVKINADGSKGSPNTVTLKQRN